MKNQKIGVVLLSGGMDSAVVAANAKKEGYELNAITLHYGQKHLREIEAAIKIAQLLGIGQETIDISFFHKIAWYSAITNSEEFQVPRQRDSRYMGKDIPITYVPLRNTFFITLAAAFLESKALDLIENKGVTPLELDASLFIAANIMDYSGYPDCRPEYYEKMAEALFRGSKLGAQYHIPINIRIPVIHHTKARIIKLGMQLGVPFEYTWSCYEGGEVPCGQCDSCTIRARGFAEAGYKDPLIARLENEGKLAKGK